MQKTLFNHSKLYVQPTSTIQIAQSLDSLVLLTSDVGTNIVAVERLREYENIPQEVKRHERQERLFKNWPLKGHVEFVNVNVRYRTNLDLALDGVNFETRSGEKIGNSSFF